MLVLEFPVFDPCLKNVHKATHIMSYAALLRVMSEASVGLLTTSVEQDYI